MSVERLKLLQSKKANLMKQKKREIAKLLEQGKDESAKVMVEHVIREDFVIEAYEILEVHTQLLLARMGVIEDEKDCPEDIREAVCSLIWTEPRCAEISEFKEIKKQFSKKYGQEFVDHASDYVNQKVLHKLSIRAPEEALVSSYLNEIARVFKVDWETQIERPLGNIPPPAIPSEFPSSPDDRSDGGSGGGGGGIDLGPDFQPPPKNYKTKPDPVLPPIPPPATNDDIPSFDDLAARFASLKKS